jgi:uncharacterized phiE125 gp8 family phage protein
MGMTLVPVAPVEGDAVVELAQVKAFLRVDGGDEDSMIDGLRAAAIDWVERYTARGLTRREWRWSLSGFSPVLRLPIGPVADDAAVTGIAYRDASGAEAAVTDGGWIVSAGAMIAAPGTVWPSSWAADGSVTVTFEAGHGDVSVEAPGLVTAVLMLIRHWYDNRGPVVTGTIASDVPMTVTALCAAYRTPMIG